MVQSGHSKLPVLIKQKYIHFAVFFRIIFLSIDVKQVAPDGIIFNQTEENGLIFLSSISNIYCLPVSKFCIVRSKQTGRE